MDILDTDDLKQKAKNISLPESHPGSWALAKDACRFLAALVRQHRPQRILEFGSGYSTTVMAGELNRYEGGHIDSIDNLERWSRQAAEMAKNLGVDRHVTFHVFPLGVKWLYGHPYVSFALPSAFLPNTKYDLILIDTPHQDVGRDGVLYSAFKYLKVGGYLFCDDCNAPHMKETIERWKARWKDSLTIQDLPDIGSGIGLIRKINERGPAFAGGQFFPAIFRAARNGIRIKTLGLNKAPKETA